MGAAPARILQSPGPWSAEQVRAKEPVELSNGHKVQCLPTGARGGSATLAVGAALATDPNVTSAGVDVGFSPEPGTLRAPDIAIGNVPNKPGWVKGVPPLAVEYADTGQDEDELQKKIRELLTAGTQMIWVVRLVAPRCVEVYEQGAASPRTALEGAELWAPGILANPVPVAAFFDPDVARRLTFRNLLLRKGYGDLDDVREEGRKEGREEGRKEGLEEGHEEGRKEGREEGRRDELGHAILDILAARGLEVGVATRSAILTCTDLERLRRWLVRAATADRSSDVTADP
jgi:Uma2 family endonuclease